MWGLLIIDYSFDTVHIVDGGARFDDKSRASEFGAVGRLSERRRLRVYDIETASVDRVLILV